jgi:hypothetical protein
MCQIGITYGFELMLAKESEHNFFRFLACRDVDLDTLEGAIFDFACALQPYVLNREARPAEFLRFLVDGAHWQGQRRLRKPDQKGKGGHLGCSEGYNFNEYKKVLPKGINSQTREQMHSRLNPCKKTLRLMNYPNFMIWTRLWLAIDNLKLMDNLSF